MTSSTQAVVTQYKILGARTATQANYGVARSANAVALANGKMGASATAAGKKMSFLQNQMRFTGRRMLFYGTLVFAALGAAAVKMGFSYQNAVQTTRVALGPLFKDQQNLEDNIRKLYKIAVFSPFLFKDTVQAFRQMYIAMHPIGISADQTTRTLKVMIDMLAVSGKSTPQNLNRVSLALQHMAYQGRLTGRTVYQLSSYLPIYDILRKKLGVASKDLSHIASLNLDPKSVLAAIISYGETEPGFAGAAKRISQGTLPGLFAQFKDILSQTMGRTTGGAFGFLETGLKKVNDAMAPLMDQRKPPKLLNVIEAIDKAISPKTHIILNIFTLLSSAIWVLIHAFGALFLTIQQILRPFEYVLNAFHGTTWAARILGYVIGVLATLWLLTATKAIIWAVALDIATISQWAYNTAVAIGAGLTTAFGIALFILMNPIRTAQLGISLLTTYLSAFRLMLLQNAVAATILDIALGPIGLAAVLILLAVFLVVLYFKWKKFHDIVNNTFKWLMNHPFVAFFIPIIGPLVTIVGLAKKLYDWIIKIKNIARHPIRFAVKIDWPNINPLHDPGGKAKGLTGRAVQNIPGSAWFKDPTPGFDIPGIPWAAKGGTVTSGGLAMVGEGGPEIVTVPAAASIIPLDRQGLAGGSGFPKFPEVLNLKTVLRVDGKDLATVVAQHRLDAEARR